MRRLFSLWRNLFDRRRVDQGLADELDATFEMLVGEKARAGMSLPEARRAARLELGSGEAIKEQVRDVRAGASADRLMRDIRYAFRQYRRSPGFTLVAVITLALGIGANAAIFVVVKSLLLDALPYRDAERLVRVYATFADGSPGRPGWTAAMVQRIADRQRSLASIAAFDSARDAAYGGEDGAQIVKIAWVEPALFKVLGVDAALGRTMNDDDRAAGHAPASGAEVGPDTARVVMVTHSAWQRLFMGDPHVTGREVRINGLPRTVIGVLPRDFVGPMGPADFYLGFHRTPALGVGAGWLGIVGRLKPGVSQEAAEREFATIDLAPTPGARSSFVATAMSLREAMVGRTRQPLLVLLSSAGLVLVIACTNLAGALLSRSLTRRKEFAVRVALGAGRGRVVRQLVTESIVLALMGGALGLGLAQAVLSGLSGLLANVLPPTTALSLGGGVAFATFAVALAAGVGLGLLPAHSLGSMNSQAALREDSRGNTSGLRSRRIRGALMASQLALCATLLAGAGLLTRSLWEMLSSPLGFNSKGVLAATIRLLPRDYPTLQSRTRFHNQLAERLRQLPGVESVAIANKPPALDPRRSYYRLERAADTTDRVVVYASVSDDYFKTLRIPLREGRTFDASEREGGPSALVISETIARRHWPEGGAVGARLRVGGESVPVVGVVGDVRNDIASAVAEPQMYMSHRQESTGRVCALLKTSGDPASYIKLVQREVTAIDPSLPVTRADTLVALVNEPLAPRQLPAVLISAFGVLALLLASIGVYGMFAAMAVAQEREFGVRMALGSRPGALAGLILRQGAGWMAAGLMGGGVGVVLVVQLLRRWLYGIPPFDPIAVGGSIAILVGAASIAVLIPVLRATRVDPMVALRAE
jgi:putative ABC transport system permease protein